MSLAEAVYKLRKARDWTQVEYAQAITKASKVQVSQGTITNVEHGRHDNPSDRMLQLLAAGFGITASQLRREAGLDPIDELAGLDSEFIQELRELEASLSAEARAALIASARQMQGRDTRRDQKQRQGRSVPPAEPETEPRGSQGGSERTTARGRWRRAVG